MIPFNKATRWGKEIDYVILAIANGHISGDGTFTKNCHAFLEQMLGVSKALLTTSCTHALEMAALLLEIGPGDEVILPSFTFVSIANAFVLRGATPIFIDIRSDTLNLDERQLEDRISKRTKAVVPVHYAGVGCEMDTISEVSRRHGIAIVEDNAHGLFGRYRGRYLGTFGDLATQSFHETKNFTCGEGGALLINDPRFSDRAEIIREKGTNRSLFFRGMVDKYSWVDLGSSFLPSDMLSAFLFAQLEAHERVQAGRSRIWRYYADHLADWAESQGVRTPFIPEHCEQPFHLFYLVMPSFDARQRFIAHMKQHGIMTVFHYQPLHLSLMGRAHGGRPGMCPVTEETSDRLVRLPFFCDLTDDQLALIVETARGFTS